MEPVLDHIQITVKDMAVAEPWYDQVMPLLGFDLAGKAGTTIESHEFHVVEYNSPKLAIAINSPRSAFKDVDVHRRRPGSVHHIAFRVGSRAEVDRIHEELVKIGTNIVTPPKEYPEYVPKGYYAVFFKDPDGIKYEVVHAPHE